MEKNKTERLLHWVMHLTFEDIDKVKLKVINSQFTSSNSGFEKVIDSVLKAARVDWKSYRPLAKLISDISKQIPNFKNAFLKKVMEPTENLAFRSSMPKLRLLRFCFDQHIFQIEDIISAIKNLPKQNKNYKFVMVVFFMKYLPIELVEYYTSDKYVARISKLYSPVLPVIKQVLTKEDKDYTFIEDIINYGYPRDTIEYAIINDDADFIRKLMLDPHFQQDEAIIDSPFDFYEFHIPPWPIEKAALFGAINVFKLFFLNGADTEDVAIFAVTGGNLNLIRLAQQEGLSFDHTLQRAVYNHHNDVFDWLLDNYDYSDLDQLSAFLRSTETDNCTALRYFLNEGFDPNAHNDKNFGGLHLAAESGSSDAFRILLDAGADPTKMTDSGLTPLHLAASNNNAEIVKMLLQIDNVDASAQISGGPTPLESALDAGMIDSTKALLESPKVDPNICGTQHTYPIHIAVRDTKLLKMLLDCPRVDLDVRDKQGWSPIEVCIYHEYFDSLKMLVSTKANINSANKLGLTALVTAIQTGSAEIVNILLSRLDIDVNIRDSKGRTPIMHAVQINEDVTEALLNHGGINLDATDLSGKTVFDYAACENIYNLIKLCHK